MPPNPLLASIHQAERDNRFLLRQFKREIGRRDAPRGKVLAVYRRARRDMRQALRGDALFLTADVAQVTGDLREKLMTVSGDIITQSANQGRTSAQKQLTAYSEAGVNFAPTGDMPDTRMLQNAAMDKTIAQLRQIERAAILGQTDLILGDDDTNLGLLTPTVTQRDFAQWATFALASGISAWLVGRDGRRAEVSPFDKQAIAAVDERTTDTCLRVHGQIQDFSDPFVLTGRPRYARKQQFPGFHDYCRTEFALYQPEFDLELTERMQKAAKSELDYRKKINAEIAKTKKKLTKLGAVPDVRIRKDDSEKVKTLRRQLRAQRRQLTREIHPASGVSQR